MNNDSPMSPKLKQDLQQHKQAEDTAQADAEKLEKDAKQIVTTRTKMEQDGIHEMPANGSQQAAPTETQQSESSEDQKQAEKVVEYGDKIKNDVISKAAPQAVEIVSVALQQQTAKLSDLTTTGRPFANLSDTTGAPTITLTRSETPFQIVDAIPSFFELKAVKNGIQDGNPQITSRNVATTDIKQIEESRELFNEQTMTVRVYPKTTVNGVSVGDPNAFAVGQIRIQQVDSPYTNMQPYVSWLENKLKYIIGLVLATDNIIYTIPKKTVIQPIAGSTMLHRLLSTFSMWENDAPHIYLSVYHSGIPWYIEALNELASRAPIELGETDTQSYNSQKISANIKAVTDQYAAACANLQFERLKSSQLSIQEYAQRCLANMFDNDEITITNQFNQEVTNLLYSPSKTEWDLEMFYIITSKPARMTIFKELLKLITPSNRFTLLNIEDVWNQGNGPTDVLSNSIFRTWIERLSVGDQMGPYTIVLLETFPHWFNLSIRMPALPVDFGAPIEILSIYLFMKTFPQLSQFLIYQLGYRLNMLLKVYLANYHQSFVLAYGEVTYEGQPKSLDGRQMTQTQSQSGYTYSIFDPVIASSKKKTVNQKYVQVLDNLRKLVTPRPHKLHLARKAAARYPYYSESYEAYTSWQFFDPGELSGEVETQFVQELIQIVSEVESLVLMRTMSGTQRETMPKPAQTWMNTFFSSMKSILRSSALPFQYTMYKYQRALMNGFAFVDQRYNPLKPFNVPPSIVISPSKSQSDSMGVPIQKDAINDIDIFFAFRMLLTLEGDHVRNINLRTKGIPNLPEAGPTIARTHGILEGKLFDEIAMGLISPARKFGMAMQLIRWIADYEDPTNPFRSVAEDFQYIMKMSNWVSLMKVIFNMFSLNFEDYFISNISGGVIDGRSMRLILRELEPKTQRPQFEAVPNTIYGKDIKLVDDFVRQHFSILTRPFLNERSSILNVSQGIYVGRFLVDELKPFQPSIEQGWTVVDYYSRTPEGRTIKNVSFETVSCKGGYSYVLSIRTDQAVQKYFLPRDRHADNHRIMLSIPSLSAIETQYKKLVAQAIHWGWLALKVSRTKASIVISDMPSRTTDYSDEMTIDAITELISKPDGEMIPLNLVTTTYATNFTQNAQTIPVYTQWVATFVEADKNLHAAVLNSGTQPTDQTKLPSTDMLEYGRPGSSLSLMTSSGKLKLDLDVINWNNSYHAVGKALVQNNVNLTYIPAQPVTSDFIYSKN